MNIKDSARKAIEWATEHCKIIMLSMLCIIIMQQLNVIKLKEELNKMDKVIEMAEQTAEDEKQKIEAIKQQSETVIEQEEKAKSISWYTILTVAGIMTLAACIVIYMRRNGIYPIGLNVHGNMKSDEMGNLFFTLKVKNPSKTSVELKDPTVNFIISSGTRRFKAGVGDLPITLQPNTEYRTTINLAGLVAKNYELSEARAISMSLKCNDKVRSTLPKMIRFQQPE